MKKLDPKHPKFQKIAEKVGKQEQRASARHKWVLGRVKQGAAIHKRKSARGRITR